MNEKKMVGKRSVLFSRPPIIIGAGSVAGEKEGNGAFGKCFDMVEEDPLFGGKTWEEAESKMQQLATRIALRKAGLEPQEIRYLVAGDLLGQLIATSFGIMNFNIPMFGVYGACSTMGESLAIGAMLVDGEFADYVVALTSSHFASAEKQFRYPLAYGSQRPYSATWTVTGSGAVSGFSIFTGKMETQRDRLCGSDGDYNRNDNRLWNQRQHEYGSLYGPGCLRCHSS